MSVLMFASLVAAALLLVGVLVLMRWTRQDSVQIVFARAYLKAYGVTNDKRESVRAAIAVLRKGGAFSDVTDEDTAFLADLFSDLHNPQTVLGRVVQRAESRRSARPLRDRDSLRRLAHTARAEGA
jgi:hypothetical protein